MSLPTCHDITSSLKHINQQKQAEGTVTNNKTAQIINIMLNGMYAHVFGMHGLRVHIVQLCLCHIIQL